MSRKADEYKRRYEFVTPDGGESVAVQYAQYCKGKSWTLWKDTESPGFYVRSKSNHSPEFASDSDKNFKSITEDEMVVDDPIGIRRLIPQFTSGSGAKK